MAGLSALVLAAGSGTRMRSARPKPLHMLCGQPMLVYVLDALAAVKPDRVVVVVGQNVEQVSKKLIDQLPDLALDFVEQRSPSGTGDAASIGLTGLEDDLVDDDDVLVVPGDTPLLQAATVAALVDHHLATGAAATVLAATGTRRGYGTVVRDRHGRVSRLGASGDEPTEAAAGDEVAVGLYCFRRSLLAPALRRVAPVDASGEIRLDEVIAVLHETGHPIEVLTVSDPHDLAGVNDRVELAEAEAELRRRTNRRWLAAGVTMVDPARTCIDATVELAPDVTLFPGTLLQGRTVVGVGAEIGPDSHLVDCAVGAGATVKKTMARDAEIGPGAVVGPFAVLEPGAQVPPGTETGPFQVFRADDGEP